MPKAIDLSKPYHSKKDLINAADAADPSGVLAVLVASLVDIRSEISAVDTAVSTLVDEIRLNRDV